MLSPARSLAMLNPARFAAMLSPGRFAGLIGRAGLAVLPAHAGSDSRDRPAQRGDAVRQIAVPESVRALCTLSRIDYEDAFLVATDAARERTAEEWARAILEDAPAAIRSTLRRGWFALGLELGPSRSERFVLGWEVRRSTRNVVLLGAGSRIGMPAELLFERGPSSLLLSTFVQQDNPLARALWAGTEPVHRRVVPQVLRQGAR